MTNDVPQAQDTRVQRLRLWVVEALISHAGFTRSDAELAFDRCIANCAEYDRFLEHLRSQSVDAVTAARATDLCPGGSAWWRDVGEPPREQMLARRFVEGYVRQAEALAGPSDVDVDFNWPDGKLFRVVEVPAGRSLGDEVIAGDGEGTGRGSSWPSATGCSDLLPICPHSGTRRTTCGARPGTRPKRCCPPRARSPRVTPTARCAGSSLRRW